MARALVELTQEGAQVVFDDDGFAAQDEKGKGDQGGQQQRRDDDRGEGSLNIKAASITIEATGTLEIKAGATLTIRGSLVNIN